MSQTDRIEKSIVLNAPRERVWAALTDAEQFGAWFGVKMAGPFRAGEPVHGRITIPGYDHIAGDWHIVSLEPQTYFAYRWHPYAVDPAVDYSAEPMTLVEFRLADEGDGTRLDVVESGFDALPIGRRTIAHEKNSGGWAAQLRNISAYVAT